MVTNGNSVNIWCQGAQSASEYQLYFEGSFFALERPKPSRSMNKVRFFISQMTSHTAGIYTCFYQSGELWSKSSNPLKLVVTGKCVLVFRCKNTLAWSQGVPVFMNAENYLSRTQTLLIFGWNSGCMFTSYKDNLCGKLSILGSSVS
jgi:hypothetical protein